ncbi:hypothetical protein DFA_02060 [Cavenderia fasciculata]|uniref:Ankyrin repeat-containing protein n=1 Tax=Cavenderia fasciculata TaxID=261658 RepID=F4PYK7_CACFS|nr:uncharacterized protein DFA_02060 [Cavenderia fasciculata]EGG19273.1 hypothetical protein DFA_02060 [Cavenderia fasciculata]|eukprot:XP_004357544.1 hypothetical protein DFA_02060 [Cavenderia fasciculata]
MLTIDKPFFNVFRSPYLLYEIFNRVYSKECNLTDERDIYMDDGKKRIRKGKYLIKLVRLGRVAQYALPWDFIKHYLPTDKDSVLLQRRVQEITDYCSHGKATFDTFLRLLEWSPDYDPTLYKGYISQVIGTLIQNGKHDIFEYFVNNYPNISYKRSQSIAAYQGNLSILKVMDSPAAVGIDFSGQHNGSDCDGIDLNDPARGGHFEVVEYLHNRGPLKADQAIDNAAYVSLDIVKFLHFNRTEGATTDAMDNAAENGHLEIVKFLHENRSEGCTTQAMDGASMNGHFEIVKASKSVGWLVGQTEGCTTKAIDYAASLEIIQFLFNNRSEGCTQKAINISSWRGNLDAVKFLHHHRSEGCTKKAIYLAAMENHMDVVKYLYENRTEGCSEDIIDRLCKQENQKKIRLDIIMYLYEKFNVQCTNLGVNRAIKKKRLDIFEYFLKRHPSSPDIWTQKLIDTALGMRNLNILKLLLENHPHLNSFEGIDKASELGSLDIVQYLHKTRTEGCTTRAIYKACQNGHLEIVKAKFLHKHRTEGCTTASIYGIFSDYNTTKYILDNKLIAKDLIEPKYIDPHNFEVAQLVNQYLNNDNDDDDENQSL